MLPGVYGFTWNIGHLIFLGIFYTVVVVIATTFVVSSLRARKDLKARKDELIRWHLDFEDLPEAARHCRHELAGEVDYRLCPNEFDCRKCAQHREFEARKSALAAASSKAPEEENTLGFDMPPDRTYHRGHTWVKPEADDTFTIGLDDFGNRLLGKPDRVSLPEVGSKLQVNGTAWEIKKQNTTLRILAPIDGEVIATGGPEQEWYLKVKANGNGVNTTHLLRNGEIQPWLLREMERLQLALAQEGVGESLADGGVLVDDPAQQQPEVNWDAVWGEMFLEP